MNAKGSHCIVEVSVDGAQGRLAVGIMNMRQALELPDMPTVVLYSSGSCQGSSRCRTMNRQELAGFVARH
jgi:hypothetical protein